MNLLDALSGYAHLISPIMLAIEDMGGKWRNARHLDALNSELMRIAMCEQGQRVMINLPYQHGKSLLSSIYFPAWYLLHFPDRRIVLVAHEEDYAVSFGSRVKTLLSRYGPPLGIEMSKDTRSKGEWLIKGHDGGMVCRGPHGGVVGRSANLFLVDDLLKGADQALSKAILQSHWDFYQTVIFGRLRRQTSLVLVGTRWSRRDIFGRILDQARRTGEVWKHLKFKAIAGEDDPLGRKPGEALWPEQVPLEHLRIAQQTNPWWSAAWQQEPEDAEGAHFKPRLWPRFADTGDAYAFHDENKRRVIYLKSEVLRFVALDWAWSKRETADCTAIGVFGLTPCGRLFILYTMNKRLRPEELAPTLASVCRTWRPRGVACEVGHPLLADHYRRYPEIGEIHWLSTGGKDKLVRALPAILMGENKRIYLPDSHNDWLEEYMSQVGNFTGINDEHDDLVDATSYGATFAQKLRPTIGMTSFWQDATPGMLVPGKREW